jgi:hypothetical protein
MMMSIDEDERENSDNVTTMDFDGGLTEAGE